MTEITDRYDTPQQEAAPRIDWGAFVAAAVVAPMWFAATGVLAFGYGLAFTLVAAVMSLPAYVLFGLPAFYLAIRSFRTQDGRPDIQAIVLSGFIANALSFPLAYFYGLYSGWAEAQAHGKALWYAGLGMLAAPMIALQFGLSYRRAVTQAADKFKCDSAMTGDQQCA